MKPTFCNDCMMKDSYVVKEKVSNKTTYECSNCASEFGVEVIVERPLGTDFFFVSLFIGVFSCVGAVLAFLGK